MLAEFEDKNLGLHPSGHGQGQFFVGHQAPFIALGDYIIPLQLGGTQGIMFGNLIWSQFGFAFNWPLGAALGPGPDPDELSRLRQPLQRPRPSPEDRRRRVALLERDKELPPQLGVELVVLEEPAEPVRSHLD